MKEENEDESSILRWSEVVDMKMKGEKQRQLQNFIFLNEWTGVTYEEKMRWLRFTQTSGFIISSTIQSCSKMDWAVWEITKKFGPKPTDIVIAGKRICIPGLSIFLTSLNTVP